MKLEILGINLEETEKRFKQLREEMIEEYRNEMKQIAKDWNNIFSEYKFYKEHGLTTEESFYCALMDCGYMTLEDLK